MMRNSTSQAIRLGAFCVFALLSMACAEVAPMATPRVPAASRTDVPIADRTSRAEKVESGPASPVPQAVASEEPDQTGEALATAPTTSAVRGTVAVRRGPIAEMLQVNGRVVGLDEQELSFPVDGTL